MTPEAIQAKMDLENFISQCPDLSTTEDGYPCSINMLAHLYNESLKAQGRTDFMTMVSIAMLCGEEYALNLKPNDKGRQCFEKLRLLSKNSPAKDFVSPSDRLKGFYDDMASKDGSKVQGEKAMIGGRKALGFKDFASAYNDAYPQNRLTWRYIHEKLEEWGDYASENGKDWALL